MGAKRKVQKDQVLFDVPLAPFTYWQIGGLAQKLFWPSSLESLQAFLTTLSPDEKITFLGLGSNVLVSDDGLSGVVVIMQGPLSEPELLASYQVRVSAGLGCAQVARFAARHNLVESEFLAGIPGTIGGALFMNAGAFGGETWNKVLSVKTLLRDGTVRERGAQEFKCGYRYCHGLKEDEWFVEATFQFQAGDGKASLEKIRTLLNKRNATQPTGQPSCGSVFRNPSHDYAARLIEGAGLKGYTIGDAEISLKHANFIVNKGNACAQDVKMLIAFIQDKVKEKYGVTLEREVLYLNDE